MRELLDPVQSNPAHTRNTEFQATPSSTASSLLHLPIPNFRRNTSSTCGLPSEEALRASRYISHIKSSEKPDAMLRFLRQVGITESHINTAALCDPRFLGSNVEMCLEPREARLRSIGFSSSDILFLFSICPCVFELADISQRIQFWISVLGSVEKILLACKRYLFFLLANHKTSVQKNISYLKEQCGLSVCLIAKLIVEAPRLISYKPESLEIAVKRAEDFGVSRSSPMFLYALVVSGSLSADTVDAKLLYLKGLGFSHEELTSMICGDPFVLKRSVYLLGHKMEFLIKEMGYDKSQLVRNPSLFNYSLKKRLIPRKIVGKMSKSKGFPVLDRTLISFLTCNEKQFVDKFVRLYEHAIPGSTKHMMLLVLERLSVLNSLE